MPFNHRLNAHLSVLAILNVYAVWALNYSKYFGVIVIGIGGKLEVCIITIEQNIESSILGNYISVKDANH